MKRPKASEVGILAAGLVACCVLTEVVLAGVVAAAIATIGGAIGLAVIAGLLLGALMFVRRRNAMRCCTPTAAAGTDPAGETRTVSQGVNSACRDRTADANAAWTTPAHDARAERRGVA